MTIKDFFKNPTKGLKPIGSCIEIYQLDFGFEAIQYVQFPYGYKFEIGNLLGLDLNHLHEQIRFMWGIEPTNTFVINPN